MARTKMCFRRTAPAGRMPYWFRLKTIFLQRPPKLQLEQTSLPPEEVKMDAEHDEHFYVFGIVDDAFDRGRHWYRVRWWGWSAEDDTWEPKRHLKAKTLEAYRAALTAAGKRLDEAK